MQVMLPFYTSLPDDQLIGLDKVVDFPCPKGEVWDGEMRAGTLMTTIWRATIDGIPVLLVAPTDRNACNLFKGDRIYGGSYNELEAYLFFCRCACRPMRLRVVASSCSPMRLCVVASSSAGAPAVPCAAFVPGLDVALSDGCSTEGDGWE